MAVYNGAVVRALGGRLLPTFYLAIRDPSSVRVKTVERKSREGGVRYVSLVFERERAIPPEEAAACIRPCDTADAAFVITVSLPIAREEQFHREVLPQAPEEWTDLFDRLCSLDSRQG